MQTTTPETLTSTLLFSRERRRQRMLQFLESFERRSWRCDAELPFLLPWSKADLNRPAFSVPADSSR